MPSIQLQTVQSLYITMKVHGETLANGTAFIVTRHGKPYLITNRHNLAGRRSDTNEPMSSTGAVPDVVEVMHNVADDLGAWRPIGWGLYDAAGRPQWYEHPRHGRKVDTVALLLTEDSPPQTVYRAYDLDAPSPGLSTRVTTDVHVVGFPFGVTGGGYLALWTRGTIASEWDVNFNNLPSFLIDARTRPGQSGSPVLIHNSGFSRMATGDVNIGAPMTQLLGVYSGRINEQSDLGVVWRVDAITAVIDGQSRPESN